MDWKQTLTAFSLRYRQYCNENGVNQAKLFKDVQAQYKTRVSYNMVYNWSRGENYRAVTLYSLVALCNVLGKDLADFLPRSE